MKEKHTSLCVCSCSRWIFKSYSNLLTYVDDVYDGGCLFSGIFINLFIIYDRLLVIIDSNFSTKRNHFGHTMAMRLLYSISYITIYTHKFVASWFTHAVGTGAHEPILLLFVYPRFCCDWSLFNNLLINECRWLVNHAAADTNHTDTSSQLAATATDRIMCTIAYMWMHSDMLHQARLPRFYEILLYNRSPQCHGATRMQNRIHTVGCRSGICFSFVSRILFKIRVLFSLLSLDIFRLIPERISSVRGYKLSIHLAKH